MFTIYEYAHDSISFVTVSFLVATQQPLAGGANAEESARIIPPVHQVATLEEARAWIEQAIPAAMYRYTREGFNVSEQKHSQAVLCITAETEGCND